MFGKDRLTQAQWLALLIPVALMAGALGSQYIGGLVPCEMCWWQRYPHIVAIVIAALGFLVPGRGPKTALVVLAALAIATSGAIGVFHAGVEYHWWNGITACTAGFKPGQSGLDMIDMIQHGPMVRCDLAQWTLFGISLAGWNAIVSFAGALTIFGLLLFKRGPEKFGR